MQPITDHTPFFDFFSPAGNRLSVETLRIRAKARSSSSVTQRNCASICDRVPRLIFQPVQLAPGGECLLCEAKLVAPFTDLRPHDVGGCFGSGHRLKFSSLTVTGKRFKKCYVFLATRRHCAGAITTNTNQANRSANRLKKGHYAI